MADTTETIADIIAEMRRADVVPFEKLNDNYSWLANRIEAAAARMKREMDEAAEYINLYLGEIPLKPEPHNWLIRNGYKNESYQESFFGQEIEEGDNGSR